MTMICRITDERINNPWEGDCVEAAPLKTLSDISLYDVGAEDLTIWVGKNKQGFQIHIEDENGDDLVQEDNIHPFAAEAMADFCRRFLACYDKVAS